MVGTSLTGGVTPMPPISHVGASRSSSPRSPSCMSARSSLSCLKKGDKSDQNQDDSGSYNVIAPMVLIGVGDVAEKRDRPTDPVDVIATDRDCPRVPDGVCIALCVELELPGAVLRDADDAVHDLLGGLVRVAEDDHVAHVHAVDRNTLANGNATDSQSRPHAARKDRRHLPGALHQCVTADCSSPENGQ